MIFDNQLANSENIHGSSHLEVSANAANLIKNIHDEAILENV